MEQLKIRSLEKIPELYSNTRERDPLVYARFTASWKGKSWFVLEWSGGDRFFGFEQVQGEPRMYGLYSLNQLSQLRSPFGVPVVQDHSFQPVRLSEFRRLERDKTRSLGR